MYLEASLIALFYIEHCELDCKRLTFCARWSVLCCAVWEGADELLISNFLSRN